MLENTEREKSRKVPRPDRDPGAGTLYCKKLLHSISQYKIRLSSLIELAIFRSEWSLGHADSVDWGFNPRKFWLSHRDPGQACWTVTVYLFNNKDGVNRAGYSCFSPSSFSFSFVVCTRDFWSLGVHHTFTRVPTIYKYIAMAARCALNLVQLYPRGMYQNYGVSYRFFWYSTSN